MTDQTEEFGKMSDSEKENNLTLRNEYAGLLVRFNSTQALRFVPLAGYLALQLWLANLLISTITKYIITPKWVDGVVLMTLPLVAWLASDIATAFEGSFSRGLTETIDRGKEVESKLKQEGIFTVTRHGFNLGLSKGQTITTAINSAYYYIVRFWAYYLPTIFIYVINNLP